MIILLLLSLYKGDIDNHTPIEKLLVVINEVGKGPKLTRGFVDSVRNIYLKFNKEHIAKKALMVLVGSGLDIEIRGDTIHIEVTTCLAADRSFLRSLQSFCTDPIKSDVIPLESPSVARIQVVAGLDCKDITKGTYSRVLATNMRMNS